MDRFKVVFTGRVLEGFESGDVRTSFSKLFSAGESALDRVFTGLPIVINKELPHDKAFALAERLRHLGMNTTLETLAPAIDTSHLSLILEDDDGLGDQAIGLQQSITPADDGERMSCPKCKHDQRRAEQCSACGVYVAKVLAMQQHNEAEQSESTDHRSLTDDESAPYLNRKQAFHSSWKVVAPIVAILLIGWRFADRLVPEAFTEAEIRTIYTEACMELDSCLGALDQQWGTCFAAADYVSYSEALLNQQNQEYVALLSRLDNCLVDESGAPMFYDAETAAF